jgi:chromosomal replication initiator protein
MTDAIRELWFKDLTIEDYEDGVITMGIKSELKQKTLTEKYTGDLARRFSDELGFEVIVNVVFTGTPLNREEMKRSIMERVSIGDPSYREEQERKRREQEEKEKALASQNNAHHLGSTMPPFNFEYTFDNFIVGSSNKFAHAACVAVAKMPAKNYNPLFIYGPSGIGKTHLLYAITNYLREQNPNVKVIYIKGEDFTNQMIDCLSRQAMPEFREKYRDCDVLLIDDIQFIAGKVSTQEEFFHTFNALYEGRKQIILTSDRQPREIKTLEDRLKTRFEWGLIADIQSPNLELRIAIIKKKAEQVGVELPEDVLTFLAENLRSNIRQIEGAIKKLGARVFLSGESIDMDLARGCISELLGGAEPTSVTVEKIFSSIYQKYGVKKEDLISTKRNKEIAYARHITIYIIREVTEMSLPNIAKIFNRDHSTIISSIETIERKVFSDAMLDFEIKEIIKEVSPNI